MVEKAVRKFLEGNAIGGRVLVAVSGGVDSVVLLEVLRRVGGMGLVVCHLDHGLRGEASRGDAEFVRGVAERWGMRFMGGVVDVGMEAEAGGLSLEEAGREARHRFLAECGRRAGTRTVMLGHHADDQVETVLANLVRGSSGLRGMRWVSEVVPRGCRKALRLCRPLLEVPRGEIERWAEREGIGYREDGTNAERDFLRNRMRHDVIPAMVEAAGRDFRAAMCRAVAMAMEDGEFLDGMAAEVAAKEELGVGELRGMAAAMRRRVVYLWLRRRGVPGCGAETVMRVLAMAEPGGAARVELAGGWRAGRTAQRLWLRREE